MICMMPPFAETSWGVQSIFKLKSYLMKCMRKVKYYKANSQVRLFLSLNFVNFVDFISFFVAHSTNHKNQLVLYTIVVDMIMNPLIEEIFICGRTWSGHKSQLD